nr:putative vacuolar protein sorting-associated protein Ist1 [Tanacetum cinerariifolium]
MLHKSFKPAKCKTSLKLATSRIKLMRNKKGVQINQMNRDLANLLQTGQDRTARIRVEHVIREEKMVAAYDLIEIYCELIVARLPIIESQKTCPIDLKEAITSVIFAAPRCSDISELADIQKQFKAKYGKDFVSAAVELRPDCGVSRMLVEKLSAVAPDIQTKVKVLSAVAKEHNIEWDATSFEMTESKPPNDLLNGPSNIEKVSIETTDPPKVQPSNVNVVHSHEEKRNGPINYSEQNKRFTLGSQDTTPADNDVGTSSATHGDTSSSGTTSERMEKRENWNMEFKDATSAAHAAAESAERAAMAARAAAQFSKEEKVAKQRPAGSHASNSRDEAHVSSGSIGEGRFKDSFERSSDDKKPKITSQHVHQSQHNTSQKATESSLDDRRPKIVNQNVDQNEYHTSQKATDRYGGNTSSSRPTAFKSNDDKIVDEKFVSDVHMEDEYFEDFKTELGSSQKESSEYENSYYFADEASRKQPSIHSSRSHSSDSGDELDVPAHDKAGKKSVVGNPFAVVNQENLFKETTNTSSNVDSPRDDEVMSDDDGGPKFDTGFDYDEVEATHSLENTHIWSPRRNTSSKSHLFTESVSFGDHSVKSVERSEADDREPASFDHSDGPDSDSESEIAKFDPEPLPQPRKTRIELNDLVEGESSLYDPEDDEKKPQSQQPIRRLLEENELKKHNEDQESYDTVEDKYDSLNFGPLTGGLRNKGGLRFPPYTKSAMTDTSILSKKSTEESSITGIETSIGSSLGSRVSKMEDKKPGSDSDSDDHKDNFPVHSSEKASKQANTRLRFTPPVAFVDDDGSDSDEEVSKHVPSRTRLGSALSRRTRGPPSVPHLKSHVDATPERVIPAYSEEVPVEPQSYTRKYKEERVPDKRQPVSPLRKTAEISCSPKAKSNICRNGLDHSIALLDDTLIRRFLFAANVSATSNENAMSGSK